MALPHTAAMLAERHNLLVVDNFLLHTDTSPEAPSFRQPVDKAQGLFSFVDTPVNPAYGDRLAGPQALRDYFESNGYSAIDSGPIVNPHGDTVFTTAGVQRLGDQIHREERLPPTPIFVAQPVITLVICITNDNRPKRDAFSYL